MRRMPVFLLALCSAPLLFSSEPAGASGRGTGAGWRAPYAQAAPARGWRGGPQAREDAVRGHRREAGWRHGRRNRFGGFYGYPFAAGGDGPALRDEARENEPRRFDPIPASTGIAYPPAGDPVIYRIERAKGRSFVRILRFGSDAGATPRLARDESGPRILTVPR